MPGPGYPGFDSANWQCQLLRQLAVRQIVKKRHADNLPVHAVELSHAGRQRLRIPADLQRFSRRGARVFERPQHRLVEIVTVDLNGLIGAVGAGVNRLGTIPRFLDLLTSVSDHLPVVAEYSISVPEPSSVFVGAIGMCLLRRRTARGG